MTFIVKYKPTENGKIRKSLVTAKNLEDCLRLLGTMGVVWTSIEYRASLNDSVKLKG